MPFLPLKGDGNGGGKILLPKEAKSIFTCKPSQTDLDVFFIEFEAAKLSMGARHPTLFTFHLEQTGQNTIQNQK